MCAQKSNRFRGFFRTSLPIAHYKNIMPFLRGKWTGADIQWTFDGQNAKKRIFVASSQEK